MSPVTSSLPLISTSELKEASPCTSSLPLISTLELKEASPCTYSLPLISTLPKEESFDKCNILFYTKYYSESPNNRNGAHNKGSLCSV